MRRTWRLKAGFIGSAVLVIGAAAGIGWTAGTDSGAIVGCAAKTGGALRIIPARESCKTTETRLQWNVVGPQGVAGPAGPAGATGATGAAGPQGPDGNAGAQGIAGPQGPTGSVGPQGPTGMDGAPGAPGSSDGFDVIRIVEGRSTAEAGTCGAATWHAVDASNTCGFLIGPELLGFTVFGTRYPAGTTFTVHATIVNQGAALSPTGSTLTTCTRLVELSGTNRTPVPGSEFCASGGAGDAQVPTTADSGVFSLASTTAEYGVDMWQSEVPIGSPGGQDGWLTEYYVVAQW